MNSPSYFEIQAENIDRAVNFYREVFGWIFKGEKNIPLEYWRIETDGPPGGLLKRPAQNVPPGYGSNSFVCSMEVENIDETTQKIKEFGGQIALAKFAVPNVCWQGYFLDTEGNTFGIFQIDENAG
jgi:uncharacterized protein